jgi:hypothetical protein
METLRTNDLAFWDNFAGLVPVKVNGIDGTSGLASTAQQNVAFTVTKNHGPYLKGEQFTRSALWVVPMKAVRKGAYQTTIKPYLVEVA